MSKAIFSILFALLIATVCQAFAPATQTRATTSLSAKKIDNAYTRGGKPSWVFEQETMYVEAPKKTVPKKTAPKKKVVAAKSTQYGAFNKAAKKAAPAKNPLASLFGK